MGKHEFTKVNVPTPISSEECFFEFEACRNRNRRPRPEGAADTSKRNHPDRLQWHPETECKEGKQEEQVLQSEPRWEGHKGSNPRLATTPAYGSRQFPLVHL